MSVSPKHLPYQNGQPGFQIALKPLALADWIEVDDQLSERLSEKDRVSKAHPEEVWQALPETLDAQWEIFDLLWDHLPRQFPDVYEVTDNRLQLREINRFIDRNPDDPTPLKAISHMVDEDLCLMIPHDNDWVLGAASLCFPSHWSLLEKFTRPMGDIHAPVPGFAERMQSRVHRIFDNLHPDRPVYRFNWSLHDEPTLHLTAPSDHPRFEGLSENALLDSAWIRVERQTLRKLPNTGAILFTVRTHMDHLGSPALSPQIREELAVAIEAMDAEQLAYKGLTHAKAEVLAALRLVQT